MHGKGIALLLVFSSVIIGRGTGLSAAEITPVEAFGALPQVSNVELSPDGSLLAWEDERQTAPTVVMFDLAAQKYRRIIPVADGTKLRSLAWADNETLLVTLSTFATYGETSASAHYEISRTFAADVGGGKDRMLLMRGGSRSLVTGANLLAWRTTKPKTVIMSTWDYSESVARSDTGTRLAGHRGDSGWVAQVFEVDTRTGKGKFIEEGTQFTDDWIVDGAGNVVARSEWDPKTEVYRVVARNGHGWREILQQQHKGRRTVFGLTRDGTALVVSSTSDRGRKILETLPLNGSASTTLLEDPAYDVAGVFSDRFTGSPISAVLGGLEESRHWFDPEAERQYSTIARAFPGKRVAVYGRSENNQRVLAAVEGPSAPRVYYLVDLVTHKADIVGEEYPKLSGVTLGEVRAITYKARDGTLIPAYLTLPPGRTDKNLPLILLPHGGPAARDDYAFDWWAQFLASRGYLVLQPQFRGSTGFGDDWREAGSRQWGKRMQDDLTDGVKALVEQGLADAQRVCIVGASYGGYAALAGAAFTPEIFRCAVSVNGVSDLPMFLGYQRAHAGGESDSLAYWLDDIGAPSDPEVIAKSPVRAVAQVKAPVLLIHAINDTVVPLFQSEKMADALTTAGKPVTLVKLDGEDHWLSKSATRVQVLKEIEKFLGASLRKDP